MYLLLLSIFFAGLGSYAEELTCPMREHILHPQGSLISLMKTYPGENPFTILKRFKVVGANETIISIQDFPYFRSGGESFISTIKIGILEADGRIGHRYFVEKSFTREMESLLKRRALLSDSGMETMPMVKTDAGSIIEEHASPSKFENSEKILDAKDTLERDSSKFKESYAKQVGVIAYHLDKNHFEPTRLLSDIIISDRRGAVFNDFGFDLGEQGESTYLYYGVLVDKIFDRGRKLLEKEFMKHPKLLKKAVEAYDAQPKQGEFFLGAGN